MKHTVSPPISWEKKKPQRKNTIAELYVDGIKVAASGTTGTGFTAGGDRDMVIGRREWSGGGTNIGQYWYGYMEEIADYHDVSKYNFDFFPEKTCWKNMSTFIF